MHTPSHTSTSLIPYHLDGRLDHQVLEINTGLFVFLLLVGLIVQRGHDHDGLGFYRTDYLSTCVATLCKLLDISTTMKTMTMTWPSFRNIMHVNLSWLILIYSDSQTPPTFSLTGCRVSSVFSFLIFWVGFPGGSPPKPWDKMRQHLEY